MTITAESLITDSITTDSIIHAEYSAALTRALLTRAEDSVDTQSGTEFWGTDDDGNTWRIHLDSECECGHGPNAHVDGDGTLWERGCAATGCDCRRMSIA